MITQKTHGGRFKNKVGLPITAQSRCNNPRSPWLSRPSGIAKPCPTTAPAAKSSVSVKRWLTSGYQRPRVFPAGSSSLCLRHLLHQTGLPYARLSRPPFHLFSFVGAAHLRRLTGVASVIDRRHIGKIRGTATGSWDRTALLESRQLLLRHAEVSAGCAVNKRHCSRRTGSAIGTVSCTVR